MNLGGMITGTTDGIPKEEVNKRGLEIVPSTAGQRLLQRGSGVS